jgi:hypothetical protein
MNDKITEARRLLLEELAELDTRRHRLQAAIDALQPDPTPAPAPTRPTLVPTTKRTPRKRPATSAIPDYNEIAAIIRQAQTDNRRPVQALAEHFGVPTSTTKNWLPKVRKLGLLEATVNGHTHTNGTPPAADLPTTNDVYPTAKPSTFATADKVWACTEDGCEFTADEAFAGEFLTHTREAHGRRPNHEERHPVVRGRTEGAHP